MMPAAAVRLNSETTSAAPRDVFFGATDYAVLDRHGICARDHK
jgi:hypothetical protein